MEKIFNFGVDPKEVVNSIFLELRDRSLEGIGLVPKFMRSLEDFANKHQSKFFDLDNIPERTPPAVFGYRKLNDLYIIPSVFNEELMREFNESDFDFYHITSLRLNWPDLTVLKKIEYSYGLPKNKYEWPSMPTIKMNYEYGRR